MTVIVMSQESFDVSTVSKVSTNVSMLQCYLSSVRLNEETFNSLIFSPDFSRHQFSTDDIHDDSFLYGKHDV